MKNATFVYECIVLFYLAPGPKLVDGSKLDCLSFHSDLNYGLNFVDLRIELI